MKNSLAWGAALVALAAGAREAAACGGCFVPQPPPQQKEGTVVTGHRMAVAVSMAQSVLWDQIQYSGDPAEFAWVLPVKPGARLELASDAWFEVLDAATSLTVSSPSVTCGGNVASVRERDGFSCGCGSASKNTMGGSSGDFAPEQDPAVKVLHEATVGPYETVTLESKKPGALDTWLADHGYQVPPDMKPIVDAYVTEGFDFIALKLVPGVGVGAMRPVRVVTPGAGFSLPLRMVGAGTGANTAIKLFIVAEGRYHTKNFPDGIVARDKIVWDFASASSNYGSLRGAGLAANGGKTFLTTFALQGTLLERFFDLQTDGSAGGAGSSIAGAYFAQGAKNDAAAVGMSSADQCRATAEAEARSQHLVVTDCTAQGACVPPPAGQLGASRFACGKLDDLAVALTGMHPNDVWVTRLEANLPRAALATDLVLEAAGEQTQFGSTFPATKWINNPCGSDHPSGAFVLGGRDGTRRGPPLPSLVASALALAACAAMARRFTRRPA